MIKINNNHNNKSSDDDDNNNTKSEATVASIMPYLYHRSSRGHQTLMRAPTAACFRMATWAPECPAAAAAAALLVRHRLWLPCNRNGSLCVMVELMV